jgi:hypothetical protein
MFSIYTRCFNGINRSDQAFSFAGTKRQRFGTGVAASVTRKLKLDFHPGNLRI